MHRGTVYNSLNNLVRKGFINFLDKSGARYYNISGSKIFETLVKDRESELENYNEMIKNVFEDIDKLRGSGDEQIVEIFYGVEAFKNLFLQIYEECKKKDIEYLFLGRGGEMQDATGESFYKYTQKLKKEMGVRCRVILDRESIKHPYHRYVAGTIRYLTGKMAGPSNIWIYGDKVLLVLFQTNPLMSVKIKSKTVADSFRDYFRHLWNSAFEIDEAHDYQKRIVHLLEHSQRFDHISRDQTLPFFIYPHKEKEFKKYRKAIEKRRKTLTGEDDIEVLRYYKKLWKKDIKTRYLISKPSLNFFFDMIKKEFGVKELRGRIRDIRENAEKYNILIKVMNFPNALNAYVTDNEFLVIMPSPEGSIGFISTQEDIMKTFSQLFDEYWDQSMDIKEFLKKYKYK